MYKGQPIANKVLHKMEQHKLQQQHLYNLRQARPVTDLDTKDSFYTLNPKKKQMLKQTKFTEIERENRLLLERITSIMGKKRASSLSHSNGTLNASFRKRQFQSIEMENAKMLKRLQEKKSDYDASKLKKEWKTTKRRIKSIANFPAQSTKKKRIGQQSGLESEDPSQMVKLCLIGTKKFVVTLKMTPKCLLILADQKNKSSELKVIEVPRGQAEQFIEQHCSGDLRGVFDCLRFNQKDGAIYLTENMPDDKQNGSRARQRVRKGRKPLYQGFDYPVMDEQQLIF